MPTRAALGRPKASFAAFLGGSSLTFESRGFASSVSLRLLGGLCGAFKDPLGFLRASVGVPVASLKFP